MRDLRIYFSNPFSDRDISLDNKKKFGEDALARFATQNTATQYDANITAMEAAQTALFGGITNVATKKAISEARTKSVNTVIDNFTTRVSKLNKLFEINEVDKQDVYQEFFPQGVMEFTRNTTKENVEQKMQFMITAITNNTAVAGGAPVLTEFTNFLAAYNTARGQQLTKFSETSSGRQALKTAEEAWDDAMFDALLDAADNNRNQPEKLSLFFNQSILRAPKSQAHDGKGRVTGVVTKSGQPLPGVRVHVVDGGIDDATTDDTGAFTSQHLPIGTYTVEYWQDDALVHTANITVVDDGDTQHDVALP